MRFNYKCARIIFYIPLMSKKPTIAPVLCLFTRQVIKKNHTSNGCKLLHERVLKIQSWDCSLRHLSTQVLWYLWFFVWGISMCFSMMTIKADPVWFLSSISHQRKCRGLIQVLERQFPYTWEGCFVGSCSWWFSRRAVDSTCSNDTTFY